MSFISTVLTFFIYFFSAAISVFLVKRGNKRGRGILALFGVLVPVVVATFRESGVDFYAYRDIYGHIHAGGTDYPIEWGWKLLNVVAPSYEALLFCAALIFYGVSYLAIRKFETRYRWISWLTVLSSCTGFFYNGTRQAIASAFVFWGVAFFFKRKYLGFILTVAAGSLFHKSAWFILVFLPVYWLVMKRIKKLGLVTILMSAAALICVPIVIFVVNKIGVFLGYIETVSFNFSLLFLLYTLPPLLLYAWKPNVFKNNKKLHLSLALYLFVIPLQFLGMRITYADRIMLYFRPLLAIAVPLIIEWYDRRGKGKNARGFYILWFAFYHIIMGVLLNENGMYPYMNFDF